MSDICCAGEVGEVEEEVVAKGGVDLFTTDSVSVSATVREENTAQSRSTCAEETRLPYTPASGGG